MLRLTAAIGFSMLALAEAGLAQSEPHGLDGLAMLEIVNKRLGNLARYSRHRGRVEILWDRHQTKASHPLSFALLTGQVSIVTEEADNRSALVFCEPFEQI